MVTGWLPGGHPAKAPYDVIFVGGAVDEVPQTLFDQLKEGGRLVTVEGRKIMDLSPVAGPLMRQFRHYPDSKSLAYSNSDRDCSTRVVKAWCTRI